MKIVLNLEDLEDVGSEGELQELLKKRGMAMSYQVVDPTQEIKDLELMPIGNWKRYFDPQYQCRVYESFEWN
tara:strand:+ start:133 stop:348 length:216 start_codon:yes stop_codon:yes gene_type:complete